LKGKDEIFGGGGNDQLHGYTGKDAINGGKGSDYIYGEAGNDKLTGGKGSDYFVFEATVEGGNGDDVITDFDVKGEQIDFLWVYSSYDYTGTNKGRDTLLSFEDGSSILLEDVKKADFQAYIESI
jgi:Ca2+-binding RTX toxin-like protein